jgi:hypothetical protein
VAQAARETISINAVSRDVSLFSSPLMVFTSSSVGMTPFLNYMKYQKNPQLIEGAKRPLPFARFVISG